MVEPSQRRYNIETCDDDDDDLLNDHDVHNDYLNVNANVVHPPIHCLVLTECNQGTQSVYVFLGAIDLLSEGRRAAHSDAAEQLFILLATLPHAH